MSDDYQSALKLLYDRINYERSSHAPYTAVHYRLDRMRALLAELDNPQQAYDIIHIAGTKGKGTTSNFIYDGLRANGRNVGLFTSPHLLKLEERFQVAGAMCSSGELVELIDIVLPVSHRVEERGLGKPTFFELTTAMGMLHFARKRCDSVVLEVGLGGRLDSTNVCIPKLSVITSISLDHQAQLGSTIAEIAAEKAGIIKPTVPVVCTALAPDAQLVIKATAKACHSELLLLDRDFSVQWQTSGKLGYTEVDHGVAEVTYSRSTLDSSFIFGDEPWTLSVLGRHQADNLAAAITALNWLATREKWDIDPVRTRLAIAKSRVAGRLQIVGNRPWQIIDTAHNPASVSAGLNAIRDHFGDLPLTVVFASSRDKDFRTMLQLILGDCNTVYCTAFLKNPRAVSPADLEAAAREVACDATAAQSAAKIRCVETPIDAWQLALENAPKHGVVLAIGSFFLAAELLEITH